MRAHCAGTCSIIVTTGGLLAQRSTCRNTSIIQSAQFDQACVKQLLNTHYAAAALRASAIQAGHTQCMPLYAYTANVQC
jgi:hypothetical protein